MLFFLVWLTTQQHQSAVAFLPVNPFLTPLRNQGRQKLATLDASDFQQLLVDILTDTKRRQTLSLSKSGVLCAYVYVLGTIGASFIQCGYSSIKILDLNYS